MDPMPSDALVISVVRAWGSERTHVVDVPDHMFVSYVALGSTFLGVELPLATRCGSLLRGLVAVCMESGALVLCPRCRRITGVERAGDDNTMPPCRTVS